MQTEKVFYVMVLNRGCLTYVALSRMSIYVNKNGYEKRTHREDSNAELLMSFAYTLPLDHGTLLKNMQH